MAFAFLQLGPAHRSVRRDGKHQVIDLGLAGVVLGEGLVTDDGVFLVLDQHERAGTDGLLVNLLGCAGLEHGVGVFLGLHAGVFHGPAGQERCVRLVQGDLDGQVVDFFDRLDQLVHAHVVEVRVVGAGDLEVRMGVFPLTLDGKDDVVRVHVAGGLEVFIAVPLDALAQGEGVFLAVRRDAPALGQARHHRCAATLEVNQSAVDLAVGIKRGAGGVDTGVEVFRAAFRAVHQRLGRCGGQRHQCGQRQCAQQRTFAGQLAAGAGSGMNHLEDSLRLRLKNNGMGELFGQVASHLAPGHSAQGGPLLVANFSGVRATR